MKNYQDSDNKNNDSDEGFDCSSCPQQFDCLTNLKICRICDSDVCQRCYDEADILFFKDWLYNCSNKCVVCERIGCGNCIRLCYTCANEGKCFDSYCENCKVFDELHCEYHDWILCKEHNTKKCQECYDNKNYSNKYEI